MAVVGLFCEGDEARRDLTLAIEELGHRVEAARELEGAVEALGASRPQLMVVSAGAPAREVESLLGEVERLQPTLPVVVALQVRDAALAVDLMKAGAAEVVAPPWTRENLSASVSKALRLRGTVLEAVRPRQEPDRRPLYAVLAIMLLLGGAWGLRARRLRQAAAEAARKPPQTMWELPYSHPSGLALRGGELWVSDWYAQAVYRHDLSTMALKRTVPFPKETPVAIAFAGDALWTVAASGVIARRMLDARLTRLAGVKDATLHTVGIAYDGLYLWTCDNQERRLHKHLMDDSLSVVASYEYPGQKPAALAFDGKSLWSVDAGNRELLRHSFENPTIVTQKVPLPEYQDGQWRPTGLAWDGSWFWTVAEPVGASEKTGRAFRHRVAAQEAAR